MMTSYTSWYLTIASLIHGQVKDSLLTSLHQKTITLHDQFECFLFSLFFFIFLAYYAISMIVKVEGVKHSGPTKLVLYFTGATNILYTFGGHAVTV